MERGINVVALVKDAERYIFLYDNESAAALMQTLGRFAGDSNGVSAPPSLIRRPQS